MVKWLLNKIKNPEHKDWKLGQAHAVRYGGKICSSVLSFRTESHSAEVNEMFAAVHGGHWSAHVVR